MNFSSEFTKLGVLSHFGELRLCIAAELNSAEQSPTPRVFRKVIGIAPFVRLFSHPQVLLLVSAERVAPNFGRLSQLSHFQQLRHSAQVAYIEAHLSSLEASCSVLFPVLA